MNKQNLFKLKDEHVLFFPCFALDSTTQDNGKIPRWNERVRVGACAGRSPQHAGNVALVLNLKTGHVSPQFHVVFDDYFETIDDLHNGVVPNRQDWLHEHRRETHLDENGTPLDNTRVWTDAELQSSMLFDAPSNENEGASINVMDAQNATAPIFQEPNFNKNERAPNYVTDA